MARPTISFKTIVPKKGFLFDLFAKEIQDAMRTRVKPALRRMFYSTVDGWETKVYFRGTIRTIPGRSIRLLVKPYGSGTELYELVTRGARPHEIEPVRAKYLRFQEGYISSTEVRLLKSYRKIRFGDVVQTKHVNHPGFEPREFDREIAFLYAPVFVKEMQRAVESYVKKQETAFKAKNVSENYIPVQRT